MLQQPLLLLLGMPSLQMRRFRAGQVQIEAALETQKAEPVLASPEQLSLLLGPLMSHHSSWVQPLQRFHYQKQRLYQLLCLPLLPAAGFDQQQRCWWPAALLIRFAEHVQLLVQHHSVSVWLSCAWELRLQMTAKRGSHTYSSHAPKCYKQALAMLHVLEL